MLPVEWYFITGLLLQIALVSVLIAWAYKKRRPVHIQLLLRFAVIYLLEYELYREVCRLVGIPPVVTPLRIAVAQWEYFLFGLFFGEVLGYVKQVNQTQRANLAAKTRVTTH